MEVKKKDILFSVTINDCEVTTFTVGGNGGSGKDTSKNGILIKHIASGATGKSTDTRSYHQNRKLAWVRMANSKEFKAWHKKECARRLGQLTSIETEVDRQIQEMNLKIEYVKPR